MTSGAADFMRHPAHNVPEERIEEARVHAVRWGTQRGSKSGRIAAQFAKSFATHAPV
jgi:predicted AAA+ superfamily ATPase